MGQVIIKVCSFIAIIVIGMLAGRSGKLGTGAGNMLSKVVFTITLPATIIHAFGAADFSRELLLLIPIGFLCAGVPFFATLALTHRFDARDRKFLLLNSGFNIGCFGLPFVQAFFPAPIVVAACMFDAGNSLMVTGGSYVITTMVVDGTRSAHPASEAVRRLTRSVAFDSYLVLMALACLGIRIPGAIVSLTEPVANANAFLSLFMVGLMVSLSVDRERLRRIAELLGGRYCACAIECALVLALLPLAPEIRALIATLVWAPVSALGPAFTLWAGGDAQLAGLANTISIFAGLALMTGALVLTGSIA
ncbi:Auxin Efflux Carrier [Coriobacterium glomerans PW2]|uniref:Auxin Efflux Carrier n=1 Tax=Coriobacterium glomerans (strain ATCC 49209 / DSM 20642 / JCM 10262 / PW2) TaxID=700015 RepID=F2N8N7_CORGP|nr:AEC family transporter [Coriobacterium glomerans]AEB07420.1 Auxin Efflux Carrier [Coriobacterium glomerans PW2]